MARPTENEAPAEAASEHKAPAKAATVKDSEAPLDTPIPLQGSGHSFMKSSRRAGTYELRFHDPRTNQPITYTITVHPESRVPGTLAAVRQFGESMREMVDKAQETEPNFRSLQWHNIDQSPRCLLMDKDGKESTKHLNYDIKDFFSGLGQGSLYFDRGAQGPEPTLARPSNPDGRQSNDAMRDGTLEGANPNHTKRHAHAAEEERTHQNAKKHLKSQTASAKAAAAEHAQEQSAAGAESQVSA